MIIPDIGPLHERPSPENFLAELALAIPLTWEAIGLQQAGKLSYGEGTAGQLRTILDHLLKIDSEIRSKTVPLLPQRMAVAPTWMFTDSWDPNCQFGNYMLGFFLAYIHKYQENDNPRPEPFPAVAEVAGLRAEQLKEEAKTPKRVPDHDPTCLAMPHHPDSHSLRILRDASLETIATEETRLESLDNLDLYAFGQQFLVVGSVDYWRKESAAHCVNLLRRGIRLTWSAFEVGYPAHIWDYEQLFLDAASCQVGETATALVNTTEDAWNLGQTRPVPWLSARLRCMFTLHQQSKVAIGAYFEDFRLAAFVDKMPPELEKDVSLIHNSYRILVAVRDQVWTTLEERLTERMQLLMKHFWRQYTPAGLIDTFGLSVARWARDRGYRVQLQHVYLPLDWLDVPVDTTRA